MIGLSRRHGENVPSGKVRGNSATVGSMILVSRAFSPLGVTRGTERKGKRRKRPRSIARRTESGPESPARSVPRSLLRRNQCASTVARTRMPERTIDRGRDLLLFRFFFLPGLSLVLLFRRARLTLSRIGSRRSNKSKISEHPFRAGSDLAFVFNESLRIFFLSANKLSSPLRRSLAHRRNAKYEIQIRRGRFEI